MLAESVTHVSGLICYLCVRTEPAWAGLAPGLWRAAAFAAIVGRSLDSARSRSRPSLPTLVTMANARPREGWIAATFR